MAASSQPGDFDAVRKSIVDLLRQPEYDDGSAGPVLVRLAWYVDWYCSTWNSLFSFLPSLLRY